MVHNIFESALQFCLSFGLGILCPFVNLVQGASESWAVGWSELARPDLSSLRFEIRLAGRSGGSQAFLHVDDDSQYHQAVMR